METLSYCQLMERCLAAEAEVMELRAREQEPIVPAQSVYHDADCDSLRPRVVNGIFVPRDCDCRVAVSPQEQTSATDAFLAELRAQGVDMVIAYHRERADALPNIDRNNAIRHSMAALDASDIAAQLRQDANIAELLAAGIITKAGE